MSYTHEVTDGENEGRAYTEIIEVPELEALLRGNVPCSFRVPKGGDSWDDGVHDSHGHQGC